MGASLNYEYKQNLIDDSLTSNQNISMLMRKITKTSLPVKICNVC